MILALLILGVVLTTILPAIVGGLMTLQMRILLIIAIFGLWTIGVLVLMVFSDAMGRSFDFWFAVKWTVVQVLYTTLCCLIAVNREYSISRDET